MGEAVKTDYNSFQVPEIPAQVPTIKSRSNDSIIKMRGAGCVELLGITVSVRDVIVMAKTSGPMYCNCVRC